MRTASTILSVIHERGRRGLPVERLYRLLFNRELYVLAYGRLYQNHGALTPGVTGETVDGMSLVKIDTIISQLRCERYQWTPVRRVYIEKKNSNKKRPLGLPTWSDKLLQEVLRLILEAYFEPQFSPHSHGFRPQRGCHTALREIYHNWTGTAWFIEGDITKCFDSLDHTILLSILSEHIQDSRFLRLIQGLLQAGYLEDWKYNATLSGVPQGSIVGPILSNIYLSRLDTFVETVLLPMYNRGTRRKENRRYYNVRSRARYHARKGHRETAAALRKLLSSIPSIDPTDPDYRRLHYLRYADDILLGFCGSRQEAEEIKRQLGTFLHDTLKLELSETKTLITHARSEVARFLGYEVEVLQDNRLRDQNGRRSTNGTIGLRIPPTVVRAKCQRYMQHGKPIHLKIRTHDTVFSIMSQYQQEYRGIVEYYRLAYNLSTHLPRLRYVMEQSLTKTLAHKLRLSVPQVYDRYKTIIETPEGPRKALQVTVERKGKPPLVATWGGISLKRQIEAILNDNPPLVWNKGTELVERLRAGVCELCGSTTNPEVHHVRHLSDLQRRGKAEKPTWVQIMAARQRKTLVTCRQCHHEIHAGWADGSHRVV